tara:strand:- start:207 stop:719 length:513 start_codon:yes stop_codon:yes gene_type:complete
MSREVMQQIADELSCYNPAADDYKGQYIHKGWAKRIKEALAQTDHIANAGKMVVEQEPVAWMHTQLSGAITHRPADLDRHPDRWTPLFASPPKRQPDLYDQTALELCEECGWKAVIPGEPCLVCVKQRQPLTLAEIDALDFKAINGGSDSQYSVRFTRAIEAKHGIGDKT